MAYAKTPFGTLISFGSMIFTGAGIPANVQTDTTSVTDAPEVDRPRKAHPTNPYGISLRGYSPGPLKPTVSTWTVAVVATPGLSAAASAAAIETAYATWVGFWRGTHTHRTIAGTTGQLGDLVVQDASGTSYTAEAELTKMPRTWKPGEIASLELVLEFILNGDWA